jgi:DNA invertase Pin-like site-specific DNA recombinase
MTRAALYLRESMDRTKDELAVSRQRKILRTLCDAREWEIVSEYVDNDVSASKSRDAAEFAKMIKDVQAGKFDVLVGNAADRIARRLSDLEYLVDLGVKVVTAQGDLNLITPEGEFQGNILVSFARMEARQKSKRQKDAALQMAQQGKPHIGPRAFAYESDGMTVREDEAEALRRAYASLLGGATLLSLCRDLTAAGFLTPAGKPWRHSGIRAILLNPRNAALRSYTETKGGRVIIASERKIIGPANWPGIVDQETFYAARALLTDDGRRTNRNGSTARKWLLGGLAVCGVCNDGTTMRVSYRSERGGSVRVYKCRKSAHLSRVADWCDWRVSEHVIARLSESDAVDLLVDNDREAVDDLRREQGTLSLRLDQLAENFADGTITGSQLRSGTERLRAKLADLEARMSNNDRVPILADLIKAADVREYWESMGLDRQRAVINSLYRVILLPRKPGRFATPIDSVIMEPKDAS